MKPLGRWNLPYGYVNLLRCTAGSPTACWHCEDSVDLHVYPQRPMSATEVSEALLRTTEYRGPVGTEPFQLLEVELAYPRQSHHVGFRSEGSEILDPLRLSSQTFNLINENVLGATIDDVTTPLQLGNVASIFNVSDERFEVVDRRLRLKAGSQLSHTADAELAVIVTATNADASLDTTQVFYIDVNEFPLPQVHIEQAFGQVGLPMPISISASLADSSASARQELSIEIDGVPETASFSAGTRSSSGRWRLEPHDWIDLMLTVMDDGIYDLQVTAVAQDRFSDDRAVTITAVTVTVDNRLAEGVTIRDRVLTVVGTAEDDSIHLLRLRDHYRLLGSFLESAVLVPLGDIDLIAVYSLYDADPLAQQVIQQEWLSPRSFSERVEQLSQGVNSGDRMIQLLPHITVFGDGLSDACVGGPGDDWILAVDELASDIPPSRAAEFPASIADPAALQLTLDDELPPWRNPFSPVDVNADGIVSPLDMLLVINALNRREQEQGLGAPPFHSPGSIASLVDVNGDGRVTPLDLLTIINHLNRNSLSNGGAEGEVLPHWDSADLPLRRKLPSSRNVTKENPVDALFGGGQFLARRRVIEFSS